MGNTNVFENSWAEWIFDFVIKAGTIILTWVFFPMAMLGIITLFEEKIALIIEKEEYTILANATPLNLGQEFTLIIRNLLWNLLLFPLYLIPLVGVVIYYSVNAYLVGNTVFRFISARTNGSEGAKKLAAKHNSKIVFAGLTIVVLTSIPFINIIAPVYAIILMVHLASRINGESSSPDSL